MMRTAFKIFILAISIALFLSNIASANEINSQALDLAGQQKYTQALAVLDSQDSEIKSGYEHRFVKARILSWAGDYSQAKQTLNGLIEEFPDNPDLQLAMGNLDYYQGNLSAAERRYETVLVTFPSYVDARKGLENVRKAKAAKVASGQNIWRLDGGMGLSTFDQDGLPDWDDQFLRVEYKPDTLAYHASLRRYKRFGLKDVEFEAGVSDAVKGGWDWGLSAGFSADENFRPKMSLGGRLGKTVKTQSGTVLYPNVTYRYDDYASGGIHTVQPGVTAYLDEGLVVSGRLIATVQEAEDDQLGWLVNARKPVSDRLSITGGFAKAPEAINGVAITTQSLFGGLTYRVDNNLDVHFNVARDDRENSYVRNSANVGFTYKR